MLVKNQVTLESNQMQSLPHLLGFPTTPFSHTQAPHPGKYFPTTPENFSGVQAVSHTYPGKFLRTTTEDFSGVPRKISPTNR